MEICVDEYKELEYVESHSKKVEYLEPFAQKSFYKKARVFTMQNGSEVMVSYQTPIVLWDINSDNMIRLQANDRYTTSATTMNHVRAFMYRHGKQTVSKGEWKVHT